MILHQRAHMNLAKRSHLQFPPTQSTNSTYLVSALLHLIQLASKILELSLGMFVVFIAKHPAPGFVILLLLAAFFDHLLQFGHATTVVVLHYIQGSLFAFERNMARSETGLSLSSSVWPGNLRTSLLPSWSSWSSKRRASSAEASTKAAAIKTRENRMVLLYLADEIEGRDASARYWDYWRQ